jgi:hypothetical protein
MSEYDKEKWVEVFHLALLELTHAKMAGRITDARQSIIDRMTELQGLPGLHHEEICAIESALHQLRVLESEESRYAAEDKHRAIDYAMDALKTIAPKILKPEYPPTCSAIYGIRNRSLLPSGNSPLG